MKLFVALIYLIILSQCFTSPLPCSGGHGPPSGPWPWAVINAATQYLFTYTLFHFIYLLIIIHELFTKKNFNLYFWLNIFIFYLQTQFWVMYGKNVRVNLFTQAAGFNWLIRILWVADTITPGSNKARTVRAKTRSKTRSKTDYFQDYKLYKFSVYI